MEATLDLDYWQGRLEFHFQGLAAERHSGSGVPPVFALEHGLDESALEIVSRAIRTHIQSRAPSWEHRLPWIVYAAEIGYRYSGYEYWQTFEEETPFWRNRGDRAWIRKCYKWFQREYGGAQPSGEWAKWFTIICWPITHAVLPKDLQRQLARVLYGIRNSFSRTVFAKPETLGDMISAHSWSESQRFQHLAQETELVGQIAAALLLEGESGTRGLLHPSTLKRVSLDLDRERLSREWLRAARHSARERARAPGFVRRRSRTSRPRSTDDARDEVAALGIEPKLILRPADLKGTTWRVSIEIPDLSGLSRRFPKARDVLTDSRCVVAGVEGRPIARGRFLYGSQRLVLSRWPAPSEVLLRFEKSEPDLEFLLRTECLLRPGPIWLFRIGSDGLGYECRSLRVRPGHRYIILSETRVTRSADVVRHLDIECRGIEGTLLELPSALDARLEKTVRDLGLTQARMIEVWPAGLTSAVWDGEGYGEWPTDEPPILGVESDHALDRISVTLNNERSATLELAGVVPGEPLFFELPVLPVGRHTIRVETESPDAVVVGDAGQLSLVVGVRDVRPHTRRLSPTGPLAARVEPVVPTLEQLWDGQVEIEIVGPPGRAVKCAASFLTKDGTRLTIRVALPNLKLPVSAPKWTSHFEKHFRRKSRMQQKYDAAHSCRLEFAADELGAFTVWCERGFVPLRWTLQERAENLSVRLIDDTGRTDTPCVSYYSFAMPALEVCLDHALEYEVNAPGGLFVATQGEFCAGVITLPKIRLLRDLTSSPAIIEDQEPSLATILIAIDVGRKWATARSSGDVLSVTNLHKALRSIIRHITALIGGSRWARAESVFEGSHARDLSILGKAVTKRATEARFVSDLVCAVTPIGQVSPRERVAHLAKLSMDHGVLRLREDRNAVLRDPEWLTEFALRLASNPGDAVDWAGADCQAAVVRLMELPTLARAARFVVVATADHGGLGTSSVEVYPGWRWT